jgi:predicted transcriptional regulator
MRYVYGVNNIVTLFGVLDSEPRLAIINYLNEHNTSSMNDLALKLGVTHSAITAHIKALAACELVFVREERGDRGVKKSISLNRERIQIDLVGHTRDRFIREIPIPVGSFTAFDIKPPCALASEEEVIGQVDDPGVFVLGERSNAEILWFASGFVEYSIPIPADLPRNVEEIELTMEISSEAPGICEEWPSDITFIVNGINVGLWISPGDYGEIKGRLNPQWWDAGWNQYGLLKHLSITREGTYMDDIQLSACTVNQLFNNDSQNLTIKIAVLEDSKNVGGVTLFGEKFGNYRLPMSVRFYGAQDDPHRNGK